MDAQNFIVNGSVITIIVGLFVAMWKFQNSKIKDKVEKSTYKTQIEAFQKDLAKGEKRFENIAKSLKTLSDEQKKMGEFLVRLDERTLHIARKNGYTGK